MQQILIVDDDPVALATARRLVERWGYEVFEARDGAQAEVLLRERGFPIAVVDIEMPKVDGLELLRRMRQLSPVTRTIMVSGYVDLSRAMRAMRLGAITIVTKPFDDPFELEAAVEMARADIQHWKKVLLKVQNLRGSRETHA